jgi:hypothetical protein
MPDRLLLSFLRNIREPSSADLCDRYHRGELPGLCVGAAVSGWSMRNESTERLGIIHYRSVPQFNGFCRDSGRLDDLADKRMER